MASPSDRSVPNSSTLLTNNEVSEQVPVDSTQNNQQSEEPVVIGKKRKKTSDIWEDFDEIETSKGVLKAVCKYCKAEYTTGKPGSSTSQMRRHIKGCMKKKMHESTQNRQPTIPFKPSISRGNPFITPGARYSNEKMREILATAIMVHEYPFTVVEDDILMSAFKYANSDFRKVTHKTSSSDCVALFESEKKVLKKLLESVNKISLTTDMWMNLVWPIPTFSYPSR
jgi:hypothetical protein